MQGAYQTYVVCLYPISDITCQCLDFLSRGGACKHIRAGVLWVNDVRIDVHCSNYSTMEEAIQSLQKQSVNSENLDATEEIHDLSTLNDNLSTLDDVFKDAAMGIDNTMIDAGSDLGWFQ